MHYPRGSEWKKWDLHIHTPASFSWQSGRGDDVYASIIEKMNASDVDVYVVTDYWSFDGYKKLLEVNASLSNAQKLKKVVFPGIELRYDILTDETPARRVNFQMVVDNNGTPEEVAHRLDQIIHRIKLSSTDKLISDQSFIEIAKTYSDDLLQSLVGKVQSQCSAQEFLKAGKMHCYVDFDNLKNSLFEDKEVCDTFMLIGPWDKYGGIAQIDKILRNDVALKILKKTDFIESSVVNNERLFHLDEDYLKGKAFGDQWKRFIQGEVKSCVCGSDQKTIEHFGELPGDTATWVKAELTFEGLRQGIYEPKYRVRLSKHKPGEPITKLSTLTLDFPSTAMRGSDRFCFAGAKHEIEFSPNLTCIIGGRGTGKSTLLELINYALNGVSDTALRDLELPVGSDLDSMIVIDDEDSNKAVEFLSQNRIESFSTDQIEFTKAIRQRLHKLAHNDGVDDLIALMAAADSDADKQIDRVRKKLSAEIQKRKLSKDLKTETNIVQSVKDPEYARLSKNLTSKLAVEKRLAGYSKTKAGILQGIDNIAEEYSPAADSPQDEYSPIVYDTMVKLNEAKLKIGEIQDNELDAKIQQAATDVEEAKVAIRDYFVGKGLSREDLSDLANASKRIADLNVHIEAQQKIIDELSREIEAYNISALRISAENYRQAIESQIIPINKELSDLSSEVKPIGLTYEFDEGMARQKLIAAIIREFDLQTRTDHMESFLPQISPASLNSKQEFIEAIKSVNDPLNYTQEKLVEVFDIDANFAVLEVMVAREFADELSNGKIAVTYDGRSLMESSFGQRCTAAIVILLYLGNNPIIIDEPEAHLDSGLIANYLVELIKKRKQSRQIIFATHNANFVINGDSELILILSDEEGKPKVLPTTIENLNTKLDLMKLEGSKEAFTIRQGKYNLAHI